MKPAPFTYHRPATLDAVLDLLAAHGADAQILAGGQSLGPLLNLRMAMPEHVIDINDLADLGQMRRRDDWFEIGALVRHHAVATSPEGRRCMPLLAAAVGTIGHYAIRQRGTMGGSLVQADPAAQIPLVALALDAEVTIQSRRGVRSVPVADFVLSAMEVALDDDEIVTGLGFPLQSPTQGWSFQNFCRRRGDYALASVAVILDLAEDGTLADLRCCVGGTAPVAQRLADLEAGARGHHPTPAWQRDTAQQIAATVPAEDDSKATEAFRREIVEVLSIRALAEAVKRARVSEVQP
ncbi:FAD binding domain-containing protein [Thetidibacter halocola]|uniref:FAD binding domain-containing protein n=1 Tax=Thetidibacter halocola TaxID=2827239 RepID=A0A8J7WK54_9RHOB|nr:FAD binding domain-containing protein [Thetidibacter halocola]